MHGRRNVKWICGLALVAAIGVAAAFFLINSQNPFTATTMRLTKIEGFVELLAQDGQALTILENMKLYSGQSVSTADKSYAYIRLDRTKTAKLDAISNAALYQDGKKLELRLIEGNLFFHVSEALEEEERFDIRTSTTVMGIRGTSGFVKQTDANTTDFYLLTGKVHLTTTDPDTGEQKDAYVEAGQRGTAIVYEEKTETQEQVEIIIHGFTEEQIPSYVAEALAEEPSLLKEIENQTTLDSEKILAQVRLNEPEQINIAIERQTMSIAIPGNQNTDNTPDTQQTLEPYIPNVDQRQNDMSDSQVQEPHIPSNTWTDYNADDTDDWSRPVQDDDMDDDPDDDIDDGWDDDAEDATGWSDSVQDDDMDDDINNDWDDDTEDVAGWSDSVQDDNMDDDINDDWDDNTEDATGWSDSVQDDDTYEAPDDDAGDDDIPDSSSNYGDDDVGSDDD